MNQGDPVIWTNAGKDQPGTFICRYGRWYVIETVTSKHGHLGLKYVNPNDVRPAQQDNGSGNP
jgi:hypothetical protein